MTSYKEFIEKIKDSQNKNEALIVGNYLDEIYASKEILPPEYFNMGGEPDWGDLSAQKIAWYGAAAHHLAMKLGKELPKWSFDGKYFLNDPYFAGGVKGDLRIILLCESPKAFRMRNIFVSANALARV